MTYSHIIFGLTNWKDLKCDDNLICIDECSFDGDKPNDLVKRYSMPYNRPELKFVIFCKSYAMCELINLILNCELEEYKTDKMDWYKNFDIKCIKNILEKEELDNYEILMEGDDMLLKFEENEYRKHKEYNDRLEATLFYKRVDKYTFEDIIKRYGNRNNIEKYEKFYKDGLEYNKQIKLTPQKQMEKELKLGLYMFIKKEKSN